MVETIRLESGHTLTGIGGSNPSLSARIIQRPQLTTLARDSVAVSRQLTGELLRFGEIVTDHLPSFITKRTRSRWVIRQRITADRDHVRELPGRNSADPVLPAQHLL